MSMLYLTEPKTCATCCPCRTASTLMQTAFERLASGEAINQPRRRLILPTGSVLHYMAASDGQYYGAKIYATNPRHGAHFLFLLYRAADAEPLAIIEANHWGRSAPARPAAWPPDSWPAKMRPRWPSSAAAFRRAPSLNAMLAVRKIAGGARLEPRSR